MAANRRSRRDSADPLYDQKVRPAIEALKFVPAYRDAWARVVGKHGLKTVKSGLRKLRGSGLGSSSLRDDLLALLRWAPMPLVSPVDPDDPDDGGGGLTTERAYYRALTPVDLQRLSDLASLPERHRISRPTPEDPWVLLEIDLSQPLRDIERELGALRDRAGIRTSKRPGRRRAWAEYAVGFAMLRDTLRKPGMPHRGLARKHLEWDPSDVNGAEAHDVTRRVRSLLKRAEEYVAEMTEHVETGCPWADEPWMFAGYQHR